MNTEIKCRFSIGKGWRVTTPAFDEGSMIDDFYAEAHRLIEEYFTSLRENAKCGLFVADYFIFDDTGVLTITLRLRHRELGRYIAERTVTHRWRDGYIAPKRKMHRPDSIISKKASRNKGKNERSKNS